MQEVCTCYLISEFDLSLVAPAEAQYELRGCIGTLQPKSLAQIASYARKSAFEDRRFEPLREEELASLQVCVSLLVDYELASHPEDWRLGVRAVTAVAHYLGARYFCLM
jgi:AMMECR1 domain-containing protein